VAGRLGHAVLRESEGGKDRRSGVLLFFYMCTFVLAAGAKRRSGPKKNEKAACTFFRFFYVVCKFDLEQLKICGLACDRATELSPAFIIVGESFFFAWQGAFMEGFFAPLRLSTRRPWWRRDSEAERVAR